MFEEVLTTPLSLGWDPWRYNAIIRLSPVQYPYDNTQMSELELFCWQTNICEVRRYVRTSPSEFIKYKQLEVKSGRGKMSRLEPFMFTLAIYPDGSATLTKDGATEPFLDFQDTTISFRRPKVMCEGQEDKAGIEPAPHSNLGIGSRSR
ncbi:conserved hypothetical protein [Culex quinquefasciatus]|uniref:Farnesoic acid O-methyl transferase domain-containing protein n=1 Tax=Culex quinquefasciatus TaxID=7176 RepID=B0XKA7_CULQU|nr:conserved hypothetical protein [Culex quinquefasciatus]|eukprot:XP_001870079.1 conserved hypothetical protein [Culex quinquefasciatus]